MKNSRFKKNKERAGLTKPHTNFSKILRPKYPPRKPGHLDKKKKSKEDSPVHNTKFGFSSFAWHRKGLILQSYSTFQRLCSERVGVV